MMHFNYWQSPKFIQDFINKVVPKKSNWTFKATKQENDSWTFTVPFIKDEALTGGTEAIIDTHYQDFIGAPAVPGDSIMMTVSTIKPDKYVAHLFDKKPAEYGDGEPFGHYYVDSCSWMIAWLCPVLEVMFGDAPEEMWVSFAKCE